MKNLAICVLVLSSALTGLCAGLTNATTARFPFSLKTWIGKEGSGVSSGEIVTEPSTVMTNSVSSKTDKTPGQEHELRWVFVGHLGKKDAYRFTYKQPVAGTNSFQQITSTKEVQFDGSRVVVFEDAQRIIVMTSPTEEDIKLAKNP